MTEQSSRGPTPRDVGTLSWVIFLQAVECAQRPDVRVVLPEFSGKHQIYSIKRDM